MLQLVGFIRKYQTAIAGALVVIGLIWAAYTAINHTYDKGFEAGASKADKLIAEARAEAERIRAQAQQRIIVLERDMRALEQQTAERIAQAQKSGEIQIKTVERIVHENPDFADIRRPNELERVRDEQLDAIKAAAERAAAAAKLPDSGTPAVPAAGDANEQ